MLTVKPEQTRYSAVFATRASPGRARPREPSALIPPDAIDDATGQVAPSPSRRRRRGPSRIFFARAAPPVTRVFRLFSATRELGLRRAINAGDAAPRQPPAAEASYFDS